MPTGFDVTVPAPTSAFAIVSVYTGLNVAVAVRAPVMVTRQVAPDTVSHPLHPVNADPLAAVAPSGTTPPPTDGATAASGAEIRTAHRRTPVTGKKPMPASACKKKKQNR